MRISNSVKLIAILCLLKSSVGFSHTLDLNLNNDAVNLDYTTQISDSELNVGGGLLHHQDNGDVYYGTLFVADNVNKQKAILAGIGGRLYYMDADKGDASGTAMGLGGFINWEIPTVTNLSLRSDFYYAPDVLAFDEVKRYMDFSVRVQYRVIEQAWLYVGYRNAEMKPEQGSNLTIDEGGLLGVMLWF